MFKDEIDTERIERRLDEIWKIGNTDDGGVTRLAYSSEETAAIEYVLDQLNDEFAVTRDSIGNVFATPEPDAESSIYLGSHLDTVFNGGRLDGTLGVISALEAIQAVLALDEQPVRPPTLAIFRGEESARFGQHTIGSRGALGMLTVEDFSAVDQSNVPLWQAMQERSLHPENLSEPTIDTDRVSHFLELHIEQGRVLEETGNRVGIVTSIRAPVRYQVTVNGDYDHSGATPMEMRRDALVGASEMITAVERIATNASREGDIVATVGDITAHKGAINKVCGNVTFPLDIRSNDVDFRDDVETEIKSELTQAAADDGLNVNFDCLSRTDPVELDTAVIESLDDTASEVDTSSLRLPSGGGHDAMNFQHAGIPTGMLFVPSVDGVSHSPEEETTMAAVRDATEIMAQTLISGLN